MSAAANTKEQSFNHQVVWITGASSGIGEALGKAFSHNGARVVLSARNIPELNRVRQACIAAGADADTVLVLPLDVLDEGALPQATPLIEPLLECKDENFL